MGREALTWREQEILALLAERLTNREIAGRLHLAESTVKEHVSNILGKLAVKNRRQAVVEAQRQGLLPGSPPAHPTRAATLPAFTTPLIGRVEERRQLARLVEEGQRLITLTGPGGAGKSRLAIKAAEESAARFEGGVFFVALAPVQGTDQLMQAIADALSFPLPTYEDPTRQLIRFLQKKHLLLVLDNFEHLLDQGASQIEQLLQAAPELHLLVTSRERLAIAGEATLLLAGLAVPGSLEGANLMAYDAVALFVQSAQSLRPTWDPAPPTLNEIGMICQLVGGMPLAIELAAAWLDVLTVAEIRTEIERSFDILAREARGDGRHASVRALFEQSWAQLAPAERALFCQVAVFRDGFTRAAAAQIAGATPLLLRRLVRKSMVRFIPETGRYEVHELLRAYGLEQLALDPADAQAVRERHAAYFADLMQAYWEQLRGSRQLEALHELKADLANIRAAWQYYVDRTQPGQMGKFLNSLWLVFWIQGQNLTAVNLFKQAADTLAGASEEMGLTVRGHAMAHQAFFTAWLGLADEAYAIAGESIEVLGSSGDANARYFAFHGLTLPAYYLERLDEELNANAHMRQIAASLNDPWLQAFAEFTTSIALLRAGAFAEAVRMANMSLQRGLAMKDLTIQVLALNALGHLYDAQDDLEQAKRCYLDSLQKARDLGFRWAVGNAIRYLGQLSLKSNDLRGAERYFLQSLSIADELGLERDIANHLVEFAQLRAAQNRASEAIVILGMLMTLPTIGQARLGEGTIRDLAQHLLDALGQDLRSDTVQEYLARGRQLELQGLLVLLKTPQTPARSDSDDLQQTRDR